ncbi:hypothetical protein CHX27_03425 [Flavobacterium aurantiibacter]|uniref:Uncharacterized protein n=1 Tax=Flavobacterium aurantiibacter TaxID=2023067 RepID=A0A256A0E0_9FLAO|nr:hypothetical protein CHX27_03425 [Flavobacterium aurantiibacter]
MGNAPQNATSAKIKPAAPALLLQLLAPADVGAVGFPRQSLLRKRNVLTGKIRLGKEKLETSSNGYRDRLG